jgi:hypothetical protein
MNYWLKSNEIFKTCWLNLCFYPYTCILILKKTIKINNIKSPKMLTLRFFFPSVYISHT